MRVSMYTESPDTIQPLSIQCIFDRLIRVPTEPTVDISFYNNRSFPQRTRIGFERQKEPIRLATALGRLERHPLSARSLNLVRLYASTSRDDMINYKVYLVAFTRNITPF